MIDKILRFFSRDQFVLLRTVELHLTRANGEILPITYSFWHTKKGRRRVVGYGPLWRKTDFYKHHARWWEINNKVDIDEVLNSAREKRKINYGPKESISVY